MAEPLINDSDGIAVGSVVSGVVNGKGGTQTYFGAGVDKEKDVPNGYKAPGIGHNAGYNVAGVQNNANVGGQAWGSVLSAQDWTKALEFVSDFWKNYAGERLDVKGAAETAAKTEPLQKQVDPREAAFKYLLNLSDTELQKLQDDLMNEKTKRPNP